MIFDLINGILSQIPGLEHYWFFRSDLYDEMPDLFVVYSFYDYPAHRGDGYETETTYVVTFSVYGKNPADVGRICRNLSELLPEYDFVRAGCSYTATDNFPGYYLRSTDWNYTMNNE